MCFFVQKIHNFNFFFNLLYWLKCPRYTWYRLIQSIILFDTFLRSIKTGLMGDTVYFLGTADTGTILTFLLKPTYGEISFKNVELIKCFKLGLKFTILSIKFTNL